MTLFMISLVAVTFTPYRGAFAASQSTLEVSSQNTSGSVFTGMYTDLLSSSGTVLQTGFTPTNFTMNSGQAYLVQVDDYGSCYFVHWADTGSSVNPRNITVSSNTQIAAVYNCGGTNSSDTSGVSINSVDQNGNAITGYYTVLYDSSSNVLSTGFTPKIFPTTSGSSYSVGVSSYDGCTFSKWSDGVVLDPRSFTASNTLANFTAIYNCGTTGGAVLTVTTQLNGGGTITGMYTLLYQNGAVVATGFSPVQFPITGGQTYSVEVQDYGNFYFQYWSGSGSVNALQTVAPSNSTSLTAVYCNGPPGTCAEPTPVNGITIYVHRIPASYWLPCFALACISGSGAATGPGASMYVVLYDGSGTIVQTGFANEQGYTFTGLTPGATYYLYPTDCDLCHGATHDVVFSYWGANVSSTRPLLVTVGTSEDAWYSCTNSCQ